jgi:hypothetical protein
VKVKQAAMTLNPYQKNSLAVQLRHLEQALRDARRHMAAPQDGILFRRQGVSRSVQRKLEPLIDQALAEIQLLAERFDLENQVEDLRSLLRAEMAGAWEGLYDTLSPKLKRYGDVDPALAKTLDPHLRHLIALSDRIARAVGEEG